MNVSIECPFNFRMFSEGAEPYHVFVLIRLSYVLCHRLEL